MHALIIGASGRTGKLVIDELLKRGHRVTTLIRNLSSMEARNGLTLVKGTPMERADIHEAMMADSTGKPEVVLVTLSAPRASDSPFAANISPPRLMADSNANVIAVMKEVGIPKIVIMQAFGAGDSWSNLNFVLRLLMSNSNMIYQYNDHNLVDKEVRASGIKHVMVRPVRLVEGGALPVKEWPNAGQGVPMMARCTRQSVAVWIVDASERSTWDNTTPVISN